VKTCHSLVDVEISIKFTAFEFAFVGAVIITPEIVVTIKMAPSNELLGVISVNYIDDI
jgi:hypothetical protein